MPLFDLPHDELTAYRSGARRPPDLDDFWGSTLAAARDAAETTNSRREIAIGFLGNC